MVILNANSKYSVISGLQIDSLSTGIGVYNLSLNSKIYNCIIKNGNWGIYCSENVELITNCIFYNQKRAPISPGIGSIKILNCTAYNYNSTNYVGAGFVRSSTGSLVTMINCVGKAHEVSLTDDFYNSQAYTAESDYNCSEDDSAPGANSIHLTTDGGNFDFVNVNSGSEHFMLKSTSACVDAGINVTEVTTDIYGTVRPINGISDIGAYEYDPSIGLPVPYTIQNLITTSRLTIEEEDGTVVLPPLQVNSADISGSLEYFTDKTLILKVRRSSANLGDGIRYKPFKQAVPLTSEGLIAYVSQELDEVLK